MHETGIRDATIAAVDLVFERAFDAAVAPGIVWGVVVGGELVHARGLGTLRVHEDRPPDADSVFRIASMTKSFTAATVISLRDEGRLALDDPAAKWVPELAGLRPFTADSPPITIRHLLTMTAGLPTDDPWGDRQQGLDLAEFAAFLREGPSLAWAPGTRFEYSNLGYGILGRVITNVAGQEYKDVVRERLLTPLGMDATTFELGEVPPGRLASGYVRRDDAWLEEPIDPYGALASMGGVFTSVRDLARWVAWFAAAFPPRSHRETGHLLSRSSRREMQQIHCAIPAGVKWASADGQPIVESSGYGYGLFIADDVHIGRIVGHSGGYPGFGSSMRWQPASGMGIVAFGNGRYAPMTPRVLEALRALAADTVRAGGVTSWPETADARSAVERLLDRWDDGEAAALFSMNVALDEPLDLRRAAIERLRQVHGVLQADETMPVVSWSPAHLEWWMTGERGRVKVEILLSPERPPRVQGLRLTSVPDPSECLANVAERLAAVLGESVPAWPRDLAAADGTDIAGIDRNLRAAAALFGPVSLGRPIAGDGETTATWSLEGERGALDLTVRLDSPDGQVAEVALVPRPIEPPR